MKIDKVNVGIKYFFDKIDCKSQYGKLALKNLTQINIDEIEKSQRLLYDVIQYDDEIKTKARDVLVSMKNISMILKDISNNSSVELVDLHEVKIQAMHTKKLEELFNNKLFSFKSVDEIISILDPNNENSFTFRLYECYDEELNQIIRKKREIEHRYYSCDDNEKSQVMQERDKVVLEEQTRVDFVIKGIVSKLVPYINNMIYNCEVITKCDLYMAKALVYNDYDYCMSEFSDGYDVSDSVLPLISDNVSKYTPLNITLKKGSTLIVGANMGGKSTILKNLAFNTYLVNFGFLPLAKKFVMPNITNIVFIQSMEEATHGLSRFGSEIKMLNTALDSLDENTLFLIDEFASSTNPSEGYLFVKTLINYCNELSAFTVLTSHYDNLSKECETYVVSGIDESMLSDDLSLTDLMNYNIYKSYENSIPKQAMLVAKYMNVNEKYLKILNKNYEKEG